MSSNSLIGWPDGLAATPDMTYESLALLYNETNEQVSGDRMAFAVACSNYDFVPKSVKGCIHKLEITTSSYFSRATMDITHEVLPNQGPCSKIIDVHDKLKIACFDNGTIIPIKNFGYKKTFNCDVRGGLTHHTSAICSISTDPTKGRLATGASTGEVAIYQIDGEHITFISRSRVSSSAITGLAHVKSATDMDSSSGDSVSSSGEGSILFSTQSGLLGLIDPRCDMGASLSTTDLTTGEPKLNIASICTTTHLGAQIVFLGGVQGQLVSIDLRNPYTYLDEYKFPEDGSIRTIKVVRVPDGPIERAFLAYTNESSAIKILNMDTMQPDEGWFCERIPDGAQQDICQVGQRLVTCGERASIGCWTWENRTEESTHNS